MSIARARGAPNRHVDCTASRDQLPYQLDGFQGRDGPTHMYIHAYILAQCLLASVPYYHTARLPRIYTYLTKEMCSEHILTSEAFRKGRVIFFAHTQAKKN